MQVQHGRNFRYLDELHILRIIRKIRAPRGSPPLPSPRTRSKIPKMQAADDPTAGAAASILTSRAASEGGLAGDPWTRPKPIVPGRDSIAGLREIDGNFRQGKRSWFSDSFHSVVQGLGVVDNPSAREDAAQREAGQRSVLLDGLRSSSPAASSARQGTRCKSGRMRAVTRSSKPPRLRPRESPTTARREDQPDKMTWRCPCCYSESISR